MRILVTGSSGHLGEAMVRTLRAADHQVVGLDTAASPFTGHVASTSIALRCGAAWGAWRQSCIPRPCTNRTWPPTPDRTFVDTNITGTLNLLEEALAVGVGRFIFTSTTSAFGSALTPPAGAPAAWITEDLRPVPKNIYGATKTAAEDLCELFHRRHRLACLILRTSRFFPEVDDDAALRGEYDDANIKANEYLYRRVDLQDVVDAHLLALEKAPSIGFGRYIISATTPFQPDDLPGLRVNAPAVVTERVPDYEAEYARRGWKMFPTIERVYVNSRARTDLSWNPNITSGLFSTA